MNSHSFRVRINTRIRASQSFFALFILQLNSFTMVARIVFYKILEFPMVNLVGIESGAFKVEFNGIAR